MRRENSEFKTSFVSEAGSLRINKDYFGFVEMDDFACYVVADGMDTDREVYAAKVAVDYVLTCFTAKPSLSARKMKRYLREANELLRKESDQLRLKASILVVITDYIRVRYVMAGNTRLYIFRSQKVVVKSRDQSYYQHGLDNESISINGPKAPRQRASLPINSRGSLFSSGPMNQINRARSMRSRLQIHQQSKQETEPQMIDVPREFEERNNLLQYLGQPGRLKPFASKKIVVQESDIMLIASSGLWEQLNDIEIIDAMEACKEPEFFVEDLQDLLLSKKKENQFIGNYTAVAIYVNKLFQKPSNRKKIIKWILIIAIPLIVIGIVLGIIFWRSNKTWTENKENVIEIEQRADEYTNDFDYERAQSEYAKAVEESKELKQTNGKKGKENKAIKARLAEKERIVQLIEDGDKAIESQDYEKALQRYQDAKRALAKYTGEAINTDSDNTKDIQQKIDECNKLIAIQDKIKLADLKEANGDYAGAAIDYAQAKQDAITAKATDLEKDLATKQAEAETKVTGSQKEAKKNEGMMLESAGDVSYSAGAMAGAVGNYRQAAAAYGAAGYTEGVTSINGKIAQIEGKTAAEEAATQAEKEKVEQQTKEDMEKQQMEAEKEKVAAEKAETKVKEEEEKAQLTALKLQAQNKELEADRYARGGDFDGAYQLYEEAYNLYSEVNQSDKAQLVAQKMSLVLAKEEKREQQLQNLTAKDWETLGDQSLKNEEYDLAITHYETAQSMYQEAGKTDKVLQTEEKVKNAREAKRISELPTPTPEPTPTPTLEPTPTPIVIFLPY